MGHGAWEPSGSRCDPLPFIIQGDCVPHPLKGAPPARVTCLLKSN